MIGWESIIQPLLHWSLPQTCLSCTIPLPMRKKGLCVACSSLLIPLEKEDHCAHCFASLNREGRCKRCALADPTLPFSRWGAVFAYGPPSSSLIRALKYRNHLELIPALAAYLVWQLFALGWEIPDFILPVPMSWEKRMVRGFNQSALLAREAASLLNCPFIDPLARRSGGWSAASLPPEAREGLSIEVSLRKKEKLPMGAKLLVIDDVITSGSTLRSCGEALAGAAPACLEAMALCIAV